MSRGNWSTELHKHGPREGDRLCPPKNSDDNHHNSNKDQEYSVETLREKYSHRSVVPVSGTDGIFAGVCLASRIYSHLDEFGDTD